MSDVIEIAMSNEELTKKANEVIDTLCNCNIAEKWSILNNLLLSLEDTITDRGMIIEKTKWGAEDKPK